tara:strand:- start:2646 stop:4100 length:1455 start_codon:yes stop_codon:yes gene_type:complete
MSQHKHLNNVRLKITTPAVDFLEENNLSQLTKPVVNFAIAFLERYFQTPLLISTPTPIQSLETPSRIILELAHTLKSLGMLESVYPVSRRFPDEPFLYGCYVKPHGYGSDFFNRDIACMRALGENLERMLWYEGDFTYKRSRRTSYKELGNSALNIFALAGFSNTQKAKHKKLQFDEHSIFTWIQGYSLTQKKEIFCPTQLISAKHSETAKEPMLRWSVTTGLATGKNLEESIIKGILEIIERDAFMITWLNKLTPVLVDLESLSKQDKEIAYVVNQLARYHIDAYVVILPTDFPVFVVNAILVDKTGIGPAITIGAGASFNKKSSIFTALREALGSRHTIRDKFKNYKLSESRDQFGREDRLIYWAQKKDSSSLDFLTKGKKESINIQEDSPDDSRMYYKQKLLDLINHCKNKNYEVTYVELTSKYTTKKTGLHTVSVIIPELQPLHLDETIPYIGGSRISSVPQQLEYRPAKTLNIEPHPFT